MVPAGGVNRILVLELSVCGLNVPRMRNIVAHPNVHGLGIAMQRDSQTSFYNAPLAKNNMIHITTTSAKGHATQSLDTMRIVKTALFC